jgi:hypothetical protein
MISPPDPLSPEPTVKYTEPLRPDDAIPDPMYKAPLLPEVATPVLSTTRPLVPAVPAFAVCRAKSPLDEAEP